MPRESRARRAERAGRIVATLFRTHPDAHCELRHRNPFELLVATVLSAQCTDRMVNSVMPDLMKRYGSPARMAAADPADLERIIRPTGFYRQKSRNLRALAANLADVHGGQVPKTMEELTRLPGVGRKTANVILGNAYGVPGLVVDTHVSRLARRMALTGETDPVGIERDLCTLVPEKDWTQFSHAMIFHGRRICDARSPRCETCPLPPDCPFPTARPGRRTAASSRRRPASRSRRRRA